MRAGWFNWGAGALLASLGVAAGLPAGPPDAGGTPGAAGEFIGLTHPYRAATLAFDQPGRVVDVVVDQGESVAAGALMLRLDDEAARARVELARVRAESPLDVDLARILERFAQGELDRLTKLEGESLASPKEISDAGAAAESAGVRRALAERARQEARLDLKLQVALLERHALRAPFDGYVTRRHKEVGEAVEPAEAVFDFVQLDPLKVTVDCPLEFASQIESGGQLEVLHRDRRWSRPATVRFVDRVADAASQTVRIELVLENRDLAWRAGEQVWVRWPAPAPRVSVLPD